jgi:hypothetical protein
LASLGDPATSTSTSPQRWQAVGWNLRRIQLCRALVAVLASQMRGAGEHVSIGLLGHFLMNASAAASAFSAS